MSNLGSIIRDLRIIKGYSQEYIANQLSISQKTISRIEQDGENISLKKLMRIAELLELELNELIDLWMIDCKSRISAPKHCSRVDDLIFHNCTVKNCPFRDKILSLAKDVDEMKRKIC